MRVNMRKGNDTIHGERRYYDGHKSQTKTRSVVRSAQALAMESKHMLQAMSKNRHLERRHEAQTCDRYSSIRRRVVLCVKKRGRGGCSIKLDDIVEKN